MEPLAPAAGWLLSRLRQEAETGLWSTLRGLVADDALAVALESVTEKALRSAVRSAPGGDALTSEDVDHVVAVLSSIWPVADVRAAPGDSVLEYLRRITAHAMACGARPVVELGDTFDATSPLSALERDHQLVLDPEAFAADLLDAWQRTVRNAALTNPVLVPLATELGHEDVVAAVRVGLDDVARQVGGVLDRLPGAAPDLVAEAAVFPQFVGVPDRNPTFVGRVDELATLDHEDIDGPDVVLTQVATGLGGVGKTALATEFCHRRREAVDVVRWLPAEDREVLVTGYAGMAPALGLRLDGLALDDAVARVRSWFETTDRSWLLVFDNVAAPSVLDGVVPRAGRGRVLVTSRYREWTGMDVLPVGAFGVDAAVALLTGLTGRERDADAEALVAWLGGLALAVEQAAAFCRQTGWSFGQYLQHLEQRAAEILARNPAALHRLPGGKGQDLTVLTVWDSSVERAAEEAEGARAVLDVLSYLGPDHIPKALLTGVLAKDQALLRQGDPLYVDTGLAALARYSLVELHRDSRDGEILTISVHRLVQEVTRLGHDEDGALEACTTAVRVLEGAFPTDASDHDLWPLCWLLAPHVVPVTRYVAGTEADQKAAAVLLTRYATYLSYAGNPVAAPVLVEAAVQMHERGAPAEHGTRLVLQANLAHSYLMAGRRSEAVSLYERVLLELERRGVDSDLPNVRSNVGLAYLSMGRWAEAGELLQRVLDDRERLLGEDHRETVRARHNLTTAHVAAGRTLDAIALQERVVADWQRILGDDHPDTLVARDVLNDAYVSAGRAAEATGLQEQVVVDCERVLGSDHPRTLRARQTLAHSYQSVGRTDEAIALQERVVADSQRVLGNDHPDLLGALSNLANMYESAGRTADGILLQEKVVVGIGVVLGERHPDAVRARSNLGYSYISAGRIAEATDLLEQVVADSEHLFGHDHPDTVQARGILARCYIAARRGPRPNRAERRRANRKR